MLPLFCTAASHKRKHRTRQTQLGGVFQALINGMSGCDAAGILSWGCHSRIRRWRSSSGGRSGRCGQPPRLWRALSRQQLQPLKLQILLQQPPCSRIGAVDRCCSCGEPLALRRCAAAAAVMAAQQGWAQLGAAPVCRLTTAALALQAWRATQCLQRRLCS